LFSSLRSTRFGVMVVCACISWIIASTPIMVRTYSQAARDVAGDSNRDCQERSLQEETDAPT
jgi:hypothetical protein